MTWWAKYVGVPFVDGGRTIEGLDCWGLVCLIYENELGIKLPSYGEISARDLLAVARALGSGRETWAVVDGKPQPYDVVGMRLYDRSWLGHVGVMISATQMIHIEEPIAASVVPLNHFTIKNRISEIRRHRGA